MVIKLTHEEYGSISFDVIREPDVRDMACIFRAILSRMGFHPRTIDEMFDDELKELTEEK